MGETVALNGLRARDSSALTLFREYRAAQAQVRRERGETCEVCRVPARATHHLASVGSTGIASPLVSDPRNLLVVCDDCHTLFHPGRRVYPWIAVGARRANRLVAA